MVALWRAASSKGMLPKAGEGEGFDGPVLHQWRCGPAHPILRFIDAATQPIAPRKQGGSAC